MNDLAFGYTHTQSTPATTWNVLHSLNVEFPVVHVMINTEAGLQRVIPLHVTPVDANNLTITFSQAQSGFAKLK